MGGQLPTKSTRRGLRAPLHAGSGALTAVMVTLASMGVTTPVAAAPDGAPTEGAPGAAALPDRAACLNAHREAQELRKAGSLVEAGKKLAICVRATCPGAVVSDCATWTTELEVITPSMSFEIEVDGHAPSDAKVWIDDVPVSDWTHAVTVNPGNHVVRVEVPSFDPHVETVPIAEGHRLRLVSIKLESKKPMGASASSAAASADTALPGSERRPVPAATIPLLVVGVAGLATFGVGAGLGKANQSSLEHSCEPNCTESQLGPMKTEYLIGDIGLGVGVAALVTTAIVYFTRPREQTRVPTVSFGVGPTFLSGSATMRW